MASFWLEYTENGQRREFSFSSGSVSVGRDKASDFVLDHPTVSRQHALIVSNGGGYQLVVLSRGGLTAIDGGQVQGEVPLYDGSQVHFGQLSFTFRSPEAPPKPAGHASGQQQGWNPGGQVGGQWDPSGSQPMQQPQQYQQPQQQPAQQQGGWDPGGWDAGGWDEPQGGGQSGGQNGQWQPSGQLQSPSAFVQQGGNEDPAESDDGLVSWDQIAASAEEEERRAAAGAGPRDAYTDFERIQQAQAKADAQTKGNPLFVLVAGIAIVGLLAFTFWPSGGTEVNVDSVDVDDAEASFIEWKKGDIDCVGEADCRGQAIKAYNVAAKTLDQRDADIVNLYVAYAQLDMAGLLLEKGGITTPPKELANLEQNKAAVKTELDALFQQRRINYREFRTRKMYRDMASTLDSIKAYFPDKRCRYHQWALEKEREMKDRGIYPRRSSL